METPSPERLAIVVDDARAVYPLLVDPTFSDVNWISLGGLAGVNGVVYALAVDGTGGVYAAGSLSGAGELTANRIAHWNGSSWTNLGSGLDAEVDALAVDGAGNLYAGGLFTNAGGVVAAHVAKWDDWNYWSTPKQSYSCAALWMWSGLVAALQTRLRQPGRSQKQMPTWIMFRL